MLSKPSKQNRIGLTIFNFCHKDLHSRWWNSIPTSSYDMHVLSGMTKVQESIRSEEVIEQ